MVIGNTGEHATLLALLHLRPNAMSWPDIAAEVALRGSATALWAESFPAGFDGMGGTEEDARADAATMWAQWAAGSDFEVISVLDPSYPVALKAVHQMPPLLFTRGEMRTNESAVSVVGSRAATAEGIRMAANVARGLVERGIAVLSGLAVGIDAAAHRAVIEAGGRPIGVIASGIERVYPAANKDLHQQVATVGALVSQFWPDAEPHKRSFGMRNATMSGLGLASVIVEAGEHSGTRIQARAAIEHGRAVVLTDRVVQRSQWARDLRHRPGVFVASSTADVMRVVDRLVEVADAPELPIL